MEYKTQNDEKLNIGIKMVLFSWERTPARIIL